jgi:uncharacterized protein (TIGR02271 family)
MQDRTRSESRTVTALFDSRADAEEAIAALSRAGISRNNIRLTPGQPGDTSRATGAPRHEEKGFWETLQDLFLPEEDRHTYAEGLRRGGYLVTVSQVSAADYPRVLDILDKEGTVNLDERAATWRAEGWRGYDAGDRERRTGAESIPVVEEELRVGKRDVSHGKVRLRSYIVETPVNERVDLREEHVNVERRPVDRPVSASDALFKERTIDVEEREEEAVVDKQARVKEEISVRKDVEHRTANVSDTVRRTEVEVEDQRRGSQPGTRRRG